MSFNYIPVLLHYISRSIYSLFDRKILPFRKTILVYRPIYSVLLKYEVLIDCYSSVDDKFIVLILKSYLENAKVIRVKRFSKYTTWLLVINSRKKNLIHISSVWLFTLDELFSTYAIET